MSLLARWRSVIPDTPETLEMRAIALAHESVAHPFGHEGVMLVDRDRTLACLFGEVDVESFAMTYRDLELDCEVVAPTRLNHEIWSTSGLRPELASLTRVRREGIVKPPSQSNVGVRRLEHRDLERVEGEDLRSELAFALRSGDVWCACLDEQPVSFASAPWQTEQFADISVDTIESQRGRGLGAIVVARLVDELIAVGKEPIWGAVVSNTASHSLARKLGFTAPAGELLVLTPHDS